MKCLKCRRLIKGLYGGKKRCKFCARAALKIHKRALRLVVLTHYCGGEPRCTTTGCKVTCIEVLELDHIHNDGGAHKRRVGRSAELYLWLINHGFPPIVKVVCANCHKARHRGVSWL